MSDLSLPLGRPSDYQESMIDQVLVIANNGGATVTQIAQELGVTRQTVWNWTQSHPDFFDAIKMCQEAATVNIEKALMGQATGAVEGSAAAAIFLLKNMAPDQYRDKHEIEHTHKVVEIDYTGINPTYLEGEYEEIEEG